MNGIVLPPDYRKQMTALLGPAAEEFLQSYQEPRTYGLRINPEKVKLERQLVELKELFRLDPVPWCGTGYYYEENVRPGKHPYHAAGVYYLQEPSAMSAVELLNPMPGDVVLDLAAAPGGKSTQIAAKLGYEGLLIANEIHPTRALILAENVERMGLANTVVVHSHPDKLAERFPSYFDKIMLDAPCSGEGMFRKDPQAIEEWSMDHVSMCATRQLEVFRAAIRMLKPGGTIGYSTCTFNRAENEELLEAVIMEYPEFVVDKVERIWPHLHKGEGHFCSVLRHIPKADGADLETSPTQTGSKRKGKREPSLTTDRSALDGWKQFQAFAREVPGLEAGLKLPEGEPHLFGEQLYWLPHGPGRMMHPGYLTGLKTPRPGLHLASIKKNRIEPAHALAAALPAIEGSVIFPPDSPEVAAYLAGQSIPSTAELPAGWLLFCAGDYPLGWVKHNSGQLKNHYPKGLRKP